MTEERIGVLCENAGIFDSPWLDTDAVMHRSGHNVGNFAFWNAANMLVAGNKVLFPFGAKASNYAGKIDRILIPAANFLNESGDLGWLADFIEELDLPCAIFGLGAQSENPETYPQLTEGTVRFLHAIAARTPFLGIRGEYSQRVCAHYGVTNTEVMGCPSILTNPDPALGVKIEKKWQTPQRRIALHAACVKGNVRNVERRLFEYLDLYPGSSYIVQRPVEFMKIVFGEVVDADSLKYLEKCAQFLAPDLTYAQFLTKLSQHTYVPYSVQSWIFYLRHFSHAVGTRIHGSILSMSAEIPTVCIHHDTRTKELCEVLAVPAIAANEVRTDRNSVSELFKVVKLDGTAFDANRMRLARKNRELLTAAGFPMSPFFDRFIND